MTGTAGSFAIPVLQGSDRVNQTPQWTSDVATRLSTIMDGAVLTPTFDAGWRTYHAGYAVTVELDSAAKRAHVVGLAERAGSPITLGATPVEVWSLPANSSWNPPMPVMGITWGLGGWVRWNITPGTTGGPVLTVQAAPANLGAQHPYNNADYIAMAGITWRRA
jgi:hypothetical protein